jgi:iron(III) transport system permease protein
MNWPLLLNSLLVSGLTPLLAGALGFAVALALASLESRWRRCLLLACVAALVLPPFLVTNCWLELLGNNGAWRGWLPLNIYSLGGTVWLLTLLTWPLTTLLVLSAWSRLEAPQLECDPMVRGGALIRGLLWPMARGAAGQAAVLTFVLALNNFAVPVILQVRVFPEQLWLAFTTRLDEAGAWAASWPMVVAPAIGLFLLRRADVAWPNREAAVTGEVFRRQLGLGWFAGCALVTLALLLLALVLPLQQLTSSPRTWSELPNLLRAAPDPIWNSFAFAAVTASLCVTISLAMGQWVEAVSLAPGFGRVRTRRIDDSAASAAFGIETGKPLKRFAGVRDTNTRLKPGANEIGHTITLQLQPWFGLALWLLFLIPGVLLGRSLIAAFNGSVLYGTAGVVLLAFTLRYCALSWTAIAHARTSVDRDVVDAARVSGASGWPLLRRIVWPQIAPQVAAAWYLTYLLCLWDVETLVLIYPPGGETLALRIFNLLHYGHHAQVNAMCVTLLALAVAPLTVWGVIQRLTGR